MIDYLYVNGDSWTYGNGIDEDPTIKEMGLKIPLFNDERSSLAWPGHLGKKLGVRVKNDSLGGASNARIVRTTCNFLNKYPKDAYDGLCVIIGWTTIERSEIYIDREGYKDYYSFNAAQKFSDQFNLDISKDVRNFNKIIDTYQKQYVTYLFSNKAAMSTYFTQVITMQNTLENLGIKYMFFNAIPWHWLNHTEQTEFEERLLANASEKFLGSLNRETFTSFIEKHNYPMSSCIHPMLDGHIAWSERLYSELKRLYPNDIT